MTHDAQSNNRAERPTKDEWTVMTYGYTLEEARHLLNALERQGWGVETFRRLYAAGALREPGAVLGRS